VTEPIKPAIVPARGVSISSSKIADLKKTLSHKAEYYEKRLEELKSMLEGSDVDVERRKVQRANLIQDIALDMGMDFSMLVQFKMDNFSTYLDKIIDPFNQYLRDVRASLNLYQSADEA
jgi:hypothetical protein